METKSFTVDVKIDANDEDEFGPYGGFHALISDPSIDRDGEIVQKGALDPLPERIPVDINHSRDVLDTIGSASPYYQGEQTWAKTYFASTDKAQEIRKLMKEGHVRAVSVMMSGAQRGQRNEKGAVPILKADLVKFGVVDVGANRNARAMAVKGADTLTLDEIADAPVHDLDDDADLAILAEATGATVETIAERLTDAQVAALAGVARSVSPKAANQAYRAIGAKDAAKAPSDPQPAPQPAAVAPAPEPTPEPAPAPVAAAEPVKTYTLDEARKELQAEIEAARRSKMLDVITDPDVVASQIGPTAVKRALYASIVSELAENIALVRIPDGVDYKQAATTAQAAVDALINNTETPETAPPGPPPAAKAAGDPQALAAARAEVIANRERASQALAKLQGLTSR